MKIQSDVFRRYPLTPSPSKSPLAAEIRLTRIYPSYFSNYEDPKSSGPEAALSREAMVVTLETTSLQRIRDEKIRFDVLSFEWDPKPTDDDGLELADISLCGMPFSIPEAAL